MTRAACLAAIVFALAVPATAEAVSAAELIALGDRAATDTAAREQLLQVDEVDGRTVDVRAALAGARGREIGARARAIAELVGDAPTGSADADRREAGEVLDDRRYTGAELPRPFAKPLEWLGERIEPVIGWINDRGTLVPGGPVVLWTLLAGLIVAAAGAITGTTIRRRALAIERARAAALPATDDPHALERAADRAEQEGEYERAVRLRFRAGLLRLDRRHVLVYRPSLTTGEVARALGAPAFVDIGARFDEIAYGGRSARREDAEAAKQGWKEVLAQAASR